VAAIASLVVNILSDCLQSISVEARKLTSVGSLTGTLHRSLLGTRHCMCVTEGVEE